MMTPLRIAETHYCDTDCLDTCQEACPVAAAKGGPRPGSGRKPLPPEEATKPRSIRLNDERWEKLKRLGSEWLARAIDRAKLKE